MREITINLTDAGWEVLINGVPSPRLARYIRNLEWARSWANTLIDLFVLGPARWLAFGVVLLLLIGQLRVDATASANLRDARVAFHMGPFRYTVMAGCESGQCARPVEDAITTAEAKEVKGVLLLVYLLGFGFTIERRFKHRQGDC